MKHLGIILVDLESDSAEDARAVVERIAQQVRHRLVIDRAAKVGGVGVEIMSGASAADLRTAMEAQRVNG